MVLLLREIFSHHLYPLCKLSLKGRIFFFPKKWVRDMLFLHPCDNCRPEENVVSGKSIGIELLQALSLSAVRDLGQVI